MDFDKVVNFGPDRKGKDLIYRLNCKKAKSELDWESHVTIDEGIKKVKNWIAANNDYLSNLSWNYIHKC